MAPKALDEICGEDESIGATSASAHSNEEDHDVDLTVPGQAEQGPPKIQWICLGIFSHLIWGLYPVAARYLQITLKLPGLLVLTGANTLALIVIQLFTCVGLGSSSGVRIGAAYSCLCFARGASNMLCASYTSALYVGIITALAPFIVAALSWVTLREDIPNCLVPALLCSSVGAILAVVGQSDWEGAALSGHDAIGMAMAFASIIISSAMRIFMKVSSASLSGLMLVSWQYMSAIPMAVASLTTLTHSAEQRLQSLSLFDVAAMLGFVLIFTILTSITQVTAVRHIGPTMDGSLQPLRLISTICGGRLFLGESVHSAIAWLGLAIILTVLTAYVNMQPRSSAVQVVPKSPGDAIAYGHVTSQSES